MSTSPERKPLFFVHLLKTAGTSLFKRWPRAFAPEAIYPNETDGDPVVVAPQIDVDHLLARWKVRGDEIRLLAGHFPLCTAELLDRDFATVTVLREPVERTLSFLRHHRQRTPADVDRPLEDIYCEQPRFDWLVHNHMAKMISLRREDMTGGMFTEADLDATDLERAKERLEGMDLVGLTTEMDTFCHELQERFRIDLGAPVHANRTATVPIEDSFRRRIAEDNALDVELYAHAVELFARRHP